MFTSQKESHCFTETNAPHPFPSDSVCLRSRGWRLFSQLAEPVTLQHRIKEPYSMWKKMQRQGGGVDSVYDAVALRVVLKAKREAGETDSAFEKKTRQLCYHVSA